VTARHPMMELADVPPKPRAGYSEHVQRVCDPLGYADCPVCGTYSGPNHLRRLGLWELWETRADSQRGVDPISGWPLGKIREHIAMIRAGG